MTYKATIWTPNEISTYHKFDRELFNNYRRLVYPVLLNWHGQDEEEIPVMVESGRFVSEHELLYPRELRLEPTDGRHAQRPVYKLYADGVEIATAVFDGLVWEIMGSGPEHEARMKEYFQSIASEPLPIATS